MDAHSVAVFAVALILNAGTPGPSIAALVSRVISSGWRDIMPFVAAMWIGEIIWLSVAMAGLTALAQSFNVGFQILKWLGIGYMCWLAWKMWRAPLREGNDELPRGRSRIAMFGAGMALTLGNPKIMVFYLALLPSLINLSAAGAEQWTVLAATALLILASVDLAWIALADRARLLLRTPRATQIANRAGALALGGAAAVIATRQ